MSMNERIQHYLFKSNYTQQEEARALELALMPCKIQGHHQIEETSTWSLIFKLVTIEFFI